MFISWFRRLFGGKNPAGGQREEALSAPPEEQVEIVKRDVVQPFATNAVVKQTAPTQIASRRKMDMAAESELAQFMDENLYELLLAEGGFTDIHRVYDRETQLAGIDVVAKTEKSVAYIDEKAQLYYINKNLPTFAFELQSINRGIEREGWFLNDSLKTDFYLLIWPFADADDVKTLQKKDITHVDALLISKKKLREKLAQIGLDKNELQDKARELRVSKRYGKTRTEHAGVYYFFSAPTYYAETPINIVIKRSYLEKIATVHYEVYPGGFRRLDQ